MCQGKMILFCIIVKASRLVSVKACLSLPLSHTCDNGNTDLRYNANHPNMALFLIGFHKWLAVVINHPHPVMEMEMALFSLYVHWGTLKELETSLVL